MLGMSVFQRLVAMFFILTPCCGQDGGARDIKVTVVVILASEEGNQVDKRLTQIAEEVRRKNPNLKSFKLASMTSESVQIGEKKMFRLVEDKQAQIIVKHGADKEDRVGLAVTPPLQGEIEYRSVCGKFLPIVTRYQTRANERLILAIRVQPCQGGK